MLISTPGSSRNAVSDYFEILAKQVQLSLVEYTTISRCQSLVDAYLSEYIKKFTTVLPGAYARHTMVTPLADSVVDMLVLFNQQHSSKFLPGKLLSNLDVTLKAKYAGTEFRQKTASVYVPFENFTFRIQPGFITNENHYLLPSPSWDDWVEYDALGYKHRFAKENGQHGGKLVNVVRMMKTWNRLSGNIFDGYYLEILVKDVLHNHQIKNYQQTISHIFKAILAEVVYKKDDPANPSLQIEGLLDVEELVHGMIHVHSAYKTTVQALNYEEEGDIAMALASWETLFPGLGA